MAELILYKQKDIDSLYITACLIKFCEHDPIQAEQCSLITKNCGECSLKVGNINDIFDIQGELDTLGLQTNIK